MNARALLAMALVSLLLTGVAEAQTVGAEPVPLPSLSPLVKRVLPAVVNVVAEIPPDAADGQGGADGPGSQGATPFDDFLRRYFEQRGLPSVPPPPAPKLAPGQKIISLGSGFIIDPAGYVVTNNHVVANAAKITVVFRDNSKHPADLVGTDPKTDLALLKIATKAKLPVLQWGDSDKVEVGDWVMAVGNPYGLGGTVTAGIVSALGRDIQQGPFDDFLQIDAPINRGSSGGPTFDTSGRVVGINTAIYSPSGGSVGIGFAIPSSIGRDVVRQLREKGRADHGFLGISVQVIGPELAKPLHMDPDNPQGVIVVDVTPGSPADKAGLVSGDIITEADGHPAQSAHDISRMVATAQVGQKLVLTTLRGGKPVKLEATIVNAPASDQAAGAAPPTPAPATTALGIWFAVLTLDVRTELHLTGAATGAVIGGIAPDSPAVAVGLLPGDLIMSIDRQPVSGPVDAARRLTAAAATGDVLILVNRHGTMQYTVIPAPATAEPKAAPK